MLCVSFADVKNRVKRAAEDPEGLPLFVMSERCCRNAAVNQSAVGTETDILTCNAAVNQPAMGTETDILTCNAAVNLSAMGIETDILTCDP